MLFDYRLDDLHDARACSGSNPFTRWMYKKRSPDGLLSGAVKGISQPASQSAARRLLYPSAWAARYSIIRRMISSDARARSGSNPFTRWKHEKKGVLMDSFSGAVKGIRTPMVSHTDLNRARLPIPP